MIMKKTIFRKTVAIVTTLILTLPVLLGLTGMMEVSAAETTQKVTLHKRALLEAEKPEGGIVNDGSIQPEFPGKPLPGVIFTAYDVTSLYNQYRLANDSVEEAFNKLKTADTTGLTTYTYDATNEAGTSSFDLPVSSTVDGKVMNAVYVIKETTAPTSVVKADNIVIALPFYQEGTTTAMTEVNLYPKNYQIKQTLEFTKYGADSNGENEVVLEGAKFVLKDGNNKYLKVTPLTSGLPDFSGVTGKDVDVREFTSTVDGSVVAADLALENGTYTFEEISSADPYHMTNLAGNIVTATILDGKITYKYYDAQGKELTAEEGATAYNYDVPTPVKTVDDEDADLDQVLNYTATLKIPTDAASYTTFDLVDIPDERLALLSELGTLKATITGTDIELTTVPTAEGENGFRFAFYGNPTDKATIIANIGKTITIEFQMTIKEGAVIDSPISNELIFENNFKDSKDTAKVQTHGKKFVKVDAYKDTPLAGAEFLVLRQGTDTTEYRTYDKDTKVYGWTTNREAANRLILVSGAEGQFEVSGLATGDYQLEEIKAPKGYQLPVQPLFDFTVTETSYTDSAQILSVPNSENGILPSTGGKGIIAFIAVGLSAVLVGGIYFYKRQQFA